MKNGDWREPPSEVVINLRNTLEEKLAPMTPNRETFSEVYRDGVIAHVESRNKGVSALSWREEVLEIRRLKKNPASPEAQEIATKIGDTLNDAVLDGRDINSDSSGLRGISLTGTLTNLAKLIPMLILLPTIIIGMGPQIVLGRLLGDSTDEGLDARTSYQLLAGMFGSLGWWPILSTTLTTICIIFNSEIDAEVGLNWMEVFGSEIWQEIISTFTLWLSLIAIFWLSGIFFALGWDPISDSAKWLRRRQTNTKVSSDLVKLRELLK